MKPTKVLCIPLILAISGCSTSLTVVRYDEKTSSTAVGAPFPLMYTRYDVDIKRQVTGCGAELKAKVIAEVKGSKSAPDPNQLFTLQTTSLSSAVKASQVKATYHPTGAVATLNASADDKTGAVVANVASIAAKVVGIGAAAGAAGGAPTEACSKEVLAALSTALKLKPEVEAAGRAVEALTAQLAEVMKRVSATGNNPDKATKEELAKVSKALADAVDASDKKSAALEKVLKTLTFTQSITWPANGDIESETVLMPQYALDKWGTLDKNPNERSKFGVTLSLKAVGGAGRHSLAVSQNVDPALGVPYRAPSPGKLRICAQDRCTEQDEALAESSGQVQQLGHVYYLPCTSRPFSSIACTLEFADTGELKSAGSENKAAIAEGLTTAAKDVMTQVAAIKETKATADTKALEAQNAALKLQVDNAKLQAALSPNATQAEIDALKLETDLDTAKKASLDAKAALKEAQAKVQP